MLLSVCFKNYSFVCSKWKIISRSKNYFLIRKLFPIKRLVLTDKLLRNNIAINLSSVVASKSVQRIRYEVMWIGL